VRLRNNQREIRKATGRKWLPREDGIRSGGKRREPDQLFLIHRIYTPPGSANSPLHLCGKLCSCKERDLANLARYVLHYGCKLWRWLCWTIFAVLYLRWMPGLGQFLCQVHTPAEHSSMMKLRPSRTIS